MRHLYGERGGAAGIMIHEFRERLSRRHKSVEDREDKISKSNS